MSTAVTAAVTEPDPLLVNAPVTYVAFTGVSCRSVGAGMNVNGN